jgi:hypothetical protein
MPSCLGNDNYKGWGVNRTQIVTITLKVVISIIITLEEVISLIMSDYFFLYPCVVVVLCCDFNFYFVSFVLLMFQGWTKKVRLTRAPWNITLEYLDLFFPSFYCHFIIYWTLSKAKLLGTPYRANNRLIIKLQV